MTRVLLAALVRAAGFAAVFLAARLLPTPPDVVGENVGLGLAIFGIYAVAAAVLAVIDALAHPLRWVAAVWAVTAVLVGLAQPLLALSEGTGFASLVWSDLAGLSAFVAVLVLVPAMVAATGTANWVWRETREGPEIPAVH